MRHMPMSALGLVQLAADTPFERETAKLVFTSAL